MFHPMDANLIVTCGKSHINFWTMEGNTLTKRQGLFEVRSCQHPLTYSHSLEKNNKTHLVPKVGVRAPGVPSRTFHFKHCFFYFSFIVYFVLVRLEVSLKFQCLFEKKMFGVKTGETNTFSSKYYPLCLSLETRETKVCAVCGICSERRCHHRRFQRKHLHLGQR